MTLSIHHKSVLPNIIALLIMMQYVCYGQNLENRFNGTVKNSGVIRFYSDSGQFKNSARVASLTNNLIEFHGTNNRFTDLDGNTQRTTAFGQDRMWRVPGLVRYTRAIDSQNVQARFYTDLDVADSARKNIPDSVFVGSVYTITLSGPRTYSGTFYYDGSAPQYIAPENGLSGTTDRYHNLSLLFSPKTVRASDEVRMDGEFNSDNLSEFIVEGHMFWGSLSTTRAPIRIRSGGTLTTGWGFSALFADVEVVDGHFIIPDLADSVVLYPNSAFALLPLSSAQLIMGDSTHFELYGGFANLYPPLSNVSFSGSSLVHYASDRPQTIQATSSAHPYGNLRTSRSIKSASGNVHLATNLEVLDTNVVMVPHSMNMRLGTADYTNNAEVVGAFRRDLIGADTSVAYRFNNEHTLMRYAVVPQSLAMDVRPITRPNAYDNTTDVFRKITVTYVGDWTAVVRAGYKDSDIPTTWVPETAERLMKMYNAYGLPNESAIKLTPTVPPTYQRRAAPGGGQLGFVELVGIRNSGADNLRLNSGNDLLLRASRDVLKAVASGRWSNPFTWDEAREPESIDRVIIDGFTVHAGYARASDNYIIPEAWPDSMSMNVVIGALPNSSLLVGSTGTFNTFSLVPGIRVALTANRVGPGLIQTANQDLSAVDIDGGLIVYSGSTFITPNLTLTPAATVFNGGVLQIGIR